LGRRPLTAETGVRVPLGVPFLRQRTSNLIDRVVIPPISPELLEGGGNCQAVEPGAEAKCQQKPRLVRRQHSRRNDTALDQIYFRAGKSISLGENRTGRNTRRKNDRHLAREILDWRDEGIRHMASSHALN